MKCLMEKNQNLLQLFKSIYLKDIVVIAFFVENIF